jgi:dCMP deaminase
MLTGTLPDARPARKLGSKHLRTRSSFGTRIVFSNCRTKLSNFDRKHCSGPPHSSLDPRDNRIMRSDDQLHIETARTAAQNSNCIRRSVGAVLVQSGTVIASGWNGVSDKYRDCREAGCPRCINGGITGTGYESCICIHAEQRAIADAAARGVTTVGSIMYVSLRPCLQCLAIGRAAGIRAVFFDEGWVYSEPFERVYWALASEFEGFGQVAQTTTVGPFGL